MAAHTNRVLETLGVKMGTPAHMCRKKEKKHKLAARRKTRAAPDLRERFERLSPEKQDRFMMRQGAMGFWSGGHFFSKMSQETYFMGVRKKAGCLKGPPSLRDRVLAHAFGGLKGLVPNQEPADVVGYIGYAVAYDPRTGKIAAALGEHSWGFSAIDAAFTTLRSVKSWAR